jgi:hypothetical protein
VDSGVGGVCGSAPVKVSSRFELLSRAVAEGSLLSILGFVAATPCCRAVRPFCRAIPARILATVCILPSAWRRLTGFERIPVPPQPGLYCGTTGRLKRTCARLRVMSLVSVLLSIPAYAFGERLFNDIKRFVRWWRCSRHSGCPWDGHYPSSAAFSIPWLDSTGTFLNACGRVPRDGASMVLPLFFAMPCGALCQDVAIPSRAGGAKTAAGRLTGQDGRFSF